MFRNCVRDALYLRGKSGQVEIFFVGLLFTSPHFFNDEAAALVFEWLRSSSCAHWAKNKSEFD